MKKSGVYVLLIVLISVLMSICVGASALDVSSVRLTDRTPAGGDAKFMISVTNNQIKNDIVRVSADDFSLYPLGDFVSVRSVPSQAEIFGKKSADFEVTIKTLDSLRPNKNHVLYMWARSELDSRIKTKFPLTIYVVSPQELIDIIAEFPDKVTPGGPVAFDVTFKNNANEVLKDLDVYITSPIFSDEDTVTLYPLKNLNKEYRFDIPGDVSAGKYSFNIRVYHKGILKGVYGKDFNVVESDDLNEKSSVNKGFLSNVVILSKINEGNTELKKIVKYPVSRLGGLFTNVNPSADVVFENGKRFYQWSFNLKPGESYEIEIITDYKLLFVVVLIILGLIALRLYYKKRTIKIEKKIFKISNVQGGISDLKIMLHITNSTNKEIHHIKVIDLLPNFIKPSSDFGTLKPSSLQKGSNGMRLLWEINSLEPEEERIISYKVHSKLHVVGNITLPSASVQYRTRGKRLVNVKSNILNFMAKRE